MRLYSRLLTVVVLSTALPLTAVAQPKQPTADDIKAIQKKFDDERKIAIEQSFPVESLTLSDELAKRAQMALDGNSLREAHRLIREARWQMPYLPPDMPKNVVRVFGNTRMRQGDAVSQVAFSPDGSKLASSSHDGTVKIWDLGNGREIRTYREQKDKIRCVAWSPDGFLIASGGGKDIHLWDPDNGQRKTILKGHTGMVNSVAFRDDGKALVSGSDDRSIRIWNVEKGVEEQIVNAAQLVNKGQLPQVIYSAVYSPNGKLIASVNGEGLLQVWKPDQPAPQQKLVLGSVAHNNAPAFQVVFSPDMKSIFTCGGDKLARQHGGTDPEGVNISGTGVRQKNFDNTLGGHSDSVYALALSPDGKTLVTGSKDKTVRIWDLNTSKVIRTLQGHSDEITSLAFSKDGTQLASSSKDQTIRVWNLSSTDEHRNFDGHEGYVWSAIFSPDGKIFASAGADRSVVIRSTLTGEVIKKFPAHSLAVTALAFSPDGTRLVSSGGDKLVKLWDVKSGTLLKEFKGHTSAVMAVAFGGNGRLLISGGADKISRIWDIDKPDAIQTLPDVRSPVSSVGLSKDGKQAFLGCADGLVHVYDVSAAPKETALLPAHLSGVGALALNGDGTRLATCGGDKVVRVWALADGTAPAPLHELKGHSNPVSSVAFSNDGRLLASGGGDLIVKVWDVQHGTELRSLRGHGDWISSVAFSTDPRFILSGSVDKTVKIWELSNEETAPPVGHTRKLNTLAVSGNGKLLASGSDDHTIKVWSMESGQELFTLAEHSENVKSLAFDPVGERLVSGGDDRKLRIWDLKTKKVLQTIECDGNPAVVVFNAKGDKFLVWYLRPGPANQNVSTVQVYDREGKPLYAITEREKQVNCLSFTNDGEWVAMGSKDGSVRIWDIAKNERPLGGDMPVHQKELGDLVFSPDKTRLVTGDEDGEIKIWDLAKKEAIKTIPAQNNGLLGLAMSPNGKRFVSMGRNGELKLWDAGKGEKIAEWELPTPINNLVFSADGKRLITANGDTTLFVFELP